MRNPKPSVSDGVITAIGVAVIGAPIVLGTAIPYLLGAIMFYGGIGSAVLYVLWRWGVALLGPTDADNVQPGPSVAIRVEGSNNVFHNVGFDGFDRALEVTKGAEGNRFSNIGAVAPKNIQAEISRDVWLQDAMMYVVNLRWPEEGDQLKDGQTAQASDALQVMRQMAHDGKMVIWGKLGPQQLHAAIPREFWVDHQVDFLRAAMADPNETATERTSHGASYVKYSSLMVSKTQIETIWP